MNLQRRVGHQALSIRVLVQLPDWHNAVIEYNLGRNGVLVEIVLRPTGGVVAPADPYQRALRGDGGIHEQRAREVSEGPADGYVERKLRVGSVRLVHGCS